MNATTALRACALAIAALTGGCGSGHSSPLLTGLGGAGGGASGGSGGAGAASADAGRDATGDAAICDCVVDGQTLTVSWDCYCKRWGCNETQPASCESFRTRKAYAGCGLVTDTVNTAGGLWISVFDSSGSLVGTEVSSDTSPYQCPSDPGVTAQQLRAGRFPEPTCESVTCSCVDGGAACPVNTGR